MRRLFLLCTAVGVLLSSGPLAAGTLSPALTQKLARLSMDPSVTVLVHLREQAPIPLLRSAQSLRRVTRAEGHREVIWALQVSARSQRDLLQWLEREKGNGRVQGYQGYWIANLVIVRALREVVGEMAARADVDWIEPDFTPVLVAPATEPTARGRDGFGETSAAGSGAQGIGVTPGLRAIRAPEVWRELGINGAGTLVANLDTGVDGTHPALRSRWRGRDGRHPGRECWLDPMALSDSIPVDTHGHGTLVMGTMTGLGATTGDTVGVAWGAEWIACNGIASGGDDPGGSNVISAYQWFADPDGDPNTVDDVPDVVQNSWGVSPDEPGYRACDPTWWRVIDNCEAAGVVTVWSAGNSGPLGQTMIVPADRASTPTNTFSVGAVNATETPWPYPLAAFSSRGPSLCDGTIDSRIKPEVVAPGVNVYTSVTGGGYRDGWSGTSLAGPHAAGVVALLRQANPDLDVDSIKQILMETARDEGRPGEDNDYGWGFIDAYAAVQRVLGHYGNVEGVVRNRSVGNAPLPGAEVSLAGTEYRFQGNSEGFYHGTALPGTYSGVAVVPGFAPDTTAIVVQAGETVLGDFGLTDVSGPALLPLGPLDSTCDTLGPYPVQARVSDPSGVDSVRVRFRVTREAAGDWREIPMEAEGDVYTAGLPGAPAGSRVSWYLRARDRAGLWSAWPAGAPEMSAAFQVRRRILATSFETPPDPGWQAGIPADAATSGAWIQADPVGSTENGRTLQPENDHTPGAGQYCFVTGNGLPGDRPGASDVDDGCTTLLSPVFDLSGEEQVFVSYWRWFGQGGAAQDDTFNVDVSFDGGSSWSALERVAAPDTVWKEASFRLDDLRPPTATTRFRFQACDLYLPGVVEAAIDDFSLEAFSLKRPAPPDTPWPHGSLLPVPNPSAGVLQVRFRLEEPGQATLRIFDALGRSVRTMTLGPLTAGPQEIPWDGRNDLGRRVPTGIYFCRLRAGRQAESRAVTILR